MSTKDFTFFVINTKARWEAGDNDNLEVLDEGITLKKDPSHILDWELGDSAGEIEATDIAVNTCGVLYILDAKGHRIITYNPSNKRREYLKGIGGKGSSPGQFNNPEGIALSEDTLYVADTGNNRIQAFARINWQIRWIVATADTEAHTIQNADSGEFQPVDIVLDTKGNLFVLDRVNHRILKFDKGGRFKGTCVESALKDTTPINIALDKAGFLYVLDRAKMKILKFETEGTDNLVQPKFNLGGLNIDPSGLAVDVDGNVYVGDTHEEGFIHTFSPAGNYAGPLLGYQGSCSSMVMDGHGNFYVIRRKEGKIAFLKFIKERYSIKEPDTFKLKPGTFISKPLDSTEKGCTWHKIVLDAEIPDKTQIDVYYYSSDDAKSEYAPSESDWSKLATFRASQLKLRDALIQDHSGRYLWLKLELRSSDEYKTPKVKSIMAFFPRISYLRYLPAVYQEDAASKDFLERFLSLFETFLWNTEEEITQLARYFDAEATPKEFIAWLGTWVGAVFDESWSSEKRRIFLQRAVALYKKRGTREGIEEIIEIYTGTKPIIVENFQLYRQNAMSEKFTLSCEENEELKRTLEQLFGEPTPYRFCVLLQPQQVESESQLKTIKRIIDTEKPAHTAAGVVVLQPWIYLDMHTYLGINTYLSKPIMRLGMTSVISRDTVLTDMEEAGQLERRSRTGIDTKLT